MKLFALLLLCAHLTGFACAVPDFAHLERCQDVVCFLSTTQSGSNWVACSLSIMTRKPISWLSWGAQVFNPTSPFRKHPSYNRLQLPLLTDEPLLYRTHTEFAKLRQIPSTHNQLIFVSRNPKELLFRAFFLSSSTAPHPTPRFIKSFFRNYLAAFAVYDSWNEENRRLVFYEDFIENQNEILIDLLEFMGEEAPYLDDYFEHQEEYQSRLLKSYSQQHHRGGRSAAHGPQPIYYTRKVSRRLLRSIDRYLEHTAPVLWDKYLKRFKTP